MSSDQGILYALNTFNQDWALVYVKPCRYTHDFMEENDYFTVSFFPEKYRGDLSILGSKSGRDGDKVALTSLTPEAGEHWVTFREAEQVLVCRKIYRQDLDLSAIPEWAAKAHYRTEAPHTMYIGEVIDPAAGKK